MSWPWQGQPTIPVSNMTPMQMVAPDVNQYQYQALSPEQQFAMQQNWHQWQTYHQQYAIWNAKYGDQYQREVEAKIIQPPLPKTEVLIQPPLPNIPSTMSIPPPLPPEPPIEEPKLITPSDEPPIKYMRDEQQHRVETNIPRDINNDDNRRWGQANQRWNQSNQNQQTNQNRGGSRFQSKRNDGNTFIDTTINTSFNDKFEDNNYNRNNYNNNNRNNFNKSNNYSNSKFNQDISIMNSSSNNTAYNRETNSNNLLSTTQDATSDEKAFDDQFKTWEDEFTRWKEQNANHPDKKAYREYEMKFEECRQKLLERREQMRRRKNEEKIDEERRLEEKRAEEKSAEERRVEERRAEERMVEERNQKNSINRNERVRRNTRFNEFQEDTIPSNFESFENNKLEKKLDCFENDQSNSNRLIEQLNSEDNIFKPVSAGIPGLDLVPDEIKTPDKTFEEVTEVIDLEVSESKKEIPKLMDQIVTDTQTDLSAISKNINTLLGDPKLLTLLQLVSNESAIQNITQQVAINPLISMLGQLSQPNDLQKQLLLKQQLETQNQLQSHIQIQHQNQIQPLLQQRQSLNFNPMCFGNTNNFDSTRRNITDNSNRSNSVRSDDQDTLRNLNSNRSFDRGFSNERDNYDKNNKNQFNNNTNNNNKNDQSRYQNQNIYGNDRNFDNRNSNNFGSDDFKRLDSKNVESNRINPSDNIDEVKRFGRFDNNEQTKNFDRFDNNDQTKRLNHFDNNDQTKNFDRFDNNDQTKRLNRFDNNDQTKNFDRFDNNDQTKRLNRFDNNEQTKNFDRFDNNDQTKRLNRFDNNDQTKNFDRFDNNDQTKRLNSFDTNDQIQNFDRFDNNDQTKRLNRFDNNDQTKNFDRFGNNDQSKNVDRFDINDQSKHFDHLDRNDQSKHFEQTDQSKRFENNDQSKRFENNDQIKNLDNIDQSKRFNRFDNNDQSKRFDRFDNNDQSLGRYDNNDHCYRLDRYDNINQSNHFDRFDNDQNKTFNRDDTNVHNKNFDLIDSNERNLRSADENIAQNQRNLLMDSNNRGQQMFNTRNSFEYPTTNKNRNDDVDDFDVFKPVKVIDYQNKSQNLPTLKSRYLGDDDDILMPVKVVDYGHKKLVVPDKDSDYLKPVTTIDYGHSSVSRKRDEMYKYKSFDYDYKRDNYTDNRLDYRGNDDYNDWVDNNSRDNIREKSWSRDNNNSFDDRNDINKIDEIIELIDSDDNMNTNDNNSSNNSIFELFESNPEYPCKWVRINTNYKRPGLPTKRGKRKNKNRKAPIVENILTKIVDPVPVPDIVPDIVPYDYFEELSSNDECEEEIPPKKTAFDMFEDDVPIPKKIIISTDKKTEVIPTFNKNCILIDDLLLNPGRKSRPQRIVLIMRGSPGSGKTYLARLIKDKEIEMGGSAPRIMSIDDYFMVESEKTEICPDTGRKINVKKMDYEYEKSMEQTYKQYLLKSFKKTVADGLFTFIIVDCVNDTLRSYEEIYSFAKANNFTPYVCDLENDLQKCLNQNIHNRSEDDIKNIIDNWMVTPSDYMKLDHRSLLQSLLIQNVEMEDVNSDEDELPCEADNNDIEPSEFGMFKSKWETGPSTEESLARLDGISKPPLRQTIEEYLQMDGWEPPIETKPGQKRVRWADLEEKRAQDKMRAIGFVVGQTDWKRMNDPTCGSSALIQTKYIERIKKN